jgi:hypothetical protein
MLAGRNKRRLAVSLTELERLWDLLVLQQLTGQILEVELHFGWAGVEELTAKVDAVDAPVGEARVQLGFDTDRIVGEEDGVHAYLNGTDASPSSRTRSTGSSSVAGLGLDLASPATAFAIASSERTCNWLELGDAGRSAELLSTQLKRLAQNWLGVAPGLAQAPARAESSSRFAWVLGLLQLQCLLGVVPGSEETNEAAGFLDFVSRAFEVLVGGSVIVDGGAATGVVARTDHRGKVAGKVRFLADRSLQARLADLREDSVLVVLVESRVGSDNDVGGG